MSYLLSGHFPGVGLLTLTDLDIGGSAYLRSLGAARFFAKSELPNGETVVYCTLHNRQSYGKLIFRRFEQEMLPVSMEWFKDKDLVPMKESNVSLEACKDWDFVLGTYTDWRLDEKYSYMPSRAFFRRHNSPAVKDEDEYRFLDWKLGDDVDLKLLEKETFAEEEILRSVDFDKWVERFEKWKR